MLKILVLLSFFITGSVHAFERLEAKPLFSENPIQSSMQVLDSKRLPLRGVRVFIEGTSLVEELITDENGEFSIPKDWTSATTVTLIKEGYIQKSYLEIEPVPQTFILNPKDGQQKLQVSKNTEGYGPLPQDGQLDFGLVIPALKKEDILSFDMSSVISPESDELDIPFYKMEVPSNLSIPRQKERYVLNITFNKPKYRSFVRTPGVYKFVALHGQFPLKKVADAMRNNKSIFEVINDFKMINSGINEVNVNENRDGQNIAINQINFADQIQIKAPQFNQDKVMLAIAVREENGLYFPTDLKRVDSLGQQSLKVPQIEDHIHVISILMNNQNLNLNSANLGSEFIRLQEAGNNLSEMSAALQNVRNTNESPQFLGLIPRPQFDGQTIQLATPTLPEGLKEAGLKITFSSVEKFGADPNTQSEVRTRQWEFYSDHWTSSITLPHMNLPETPSGHIKRWEVVFLAAKQDKEVLRENLESISHLSRNVLDF